jgi:lipoate-protein ligase A
VAQDRIDLVRRPSGGRAVLHGGDLTYAVVWPQPRGSRSEIYGRALQWLVHGFAAMGQPLGSGQQAASLQRSSCFASSTVADLVHPGGAKRVGSAQLWRRGHLLQHGSIQLDPCPELWREVFGCDPPPLDPLPLAGAALEEHLSRSALHWLPLIDGVNGGDGAEVNGGDGDEGVGGRAPLRETQDDRQAPQPLSAGELARIAPTLELYRPT